MFSSFSGGSAEPQRLDQGAGCHGLLSHLILLKPLPTELQGHEWIRACSTPVGVSRPAWVSQRGSGCSSTAVGTRQRQGTCSHLQLYQLWEDAALQSQLQQHKMSVCMTAPTKASTKLVLCLWPISGIQKWWVMSHYWLWGGLLTAQRKSMDEDFPPRNKQTIKQTNQPPTPAQD